MGISSLPHEVFVKIMGHVRFDGEDGLSSCLLVSRYWSTVAHPLAWDSVVLNTRTLASFNKLAEWSPRIYQYLRSLTLRPNTLWPTLVENRAISACELQYYEGANSRTAELWKNLDVLADQIRCHMKNLISFSLRINRFPPGGRNPKLLNG